MIRRLCLTMLIAGSVLGMPAAGSARASCDVTVSAATVEIGMPITISGVNFSPNSVVSVWVDNAVVYQGAADGAGSMSTTYTFSSPGSHFVHASTTLREGSCTTTRRQVVVIPATTTTTMPPPPPPGPPDDTPEIIFGLGGDCSLTITRFDDGGYPVDLPPGESFHVDGTGFASDPSAPIDPNSGEYAHVVRFRSATSQTPLALTNQLPGELQGQGYFVGDGDGVPNSIGEIHVEVMVPDWPEGDYWIEVSQQPPYNICTITFLLHVDQPDESAMGPCSITIMQFTTSSDLPYFMHGKYVTFGSGFTPGEMVVLTLANSPSFDPEDVISGPKGPVTPGGTFTWVFAPPNDIVDTDGAPEWWARSKSCTATATLGAQLAIDPATLPPLTLTPEELQTIGITVSPGICNMILFEEHLEPVPGVDPEYHHPANENFLAAFGTGFTPGAELGFLVDGQSLHPELVTVDDSGKFYVGGSALPLSALSEQGFLTAEVDPPFVLSAVGDTCATSAQYSEGLHPWDTGPIIDASTPPVTSIGPPQPADGKGLAVGEMLILSALGIGGVIGGFAGGSALGRRSAVSATRHSGRV